MLRTKTCDIFDMTFFLKRTDSSGFEGREIALLQQRSMEVPDVWVSQRGKNCRGKAFLKRVPKIENGYPFYIEPELPKSN